MTSNDPSKPQLHMLWPADRRSVPAAPCPSDYSIRLYKSGDEAPFLQLMSLTDFDPWDTAKLEYNVNRVIPSGWFFAINTSGQVVGTAMCLHNYSGREPFTGDLGWLACHPEHRGRGLGLSLTSHVTERFLIAGYDIIQLHTEYNRLAAIKTYLKLGYVPTIGSPKLADLWQEVCSKLDWVFSPDQWSHAD